MFGSPQKQKISNSGPQILVVSGMHRSGTSAVSGTLACLGFKPYSADLADPASDNPRGFFENKKIKQINDKVLASFNLRWWDALYPFWREGVVDKNIRREALEYLSVCLSDQPSLLIKDPRFCVTLPFWMPIFEALGVPVNLAFVYRQPDQIADSLRRRDGFSEAHGNLLALSYWIQLLDIGMPILKKVISLEALFIDPASLLIDLGQQLELQHEVDDRLLGRLRREFLDVSLFKTDSANTRDVRNEEQLGWSAKNVSYLADLIDGRFAHNSTHGDFRGRFHTLKDEWTQRTEILGDVEKIRGPKWRFNPPPLGVEVPVGDSRD